MVFISLGHCDQALHCFWMIAHTHTHRLRHWIGKTYTNAQHLWINRIFIAAHCSAKRKRDESHTLPTQHTHHDSRSTTTKIAVYEMCLLMKLMIHFTDWTRIKTTHTCRCHRCHRCHRCYRHTNLKSHNSIKMWERERAIQTWWLSIAVVQSSAMLPGPPTKEWEHRLHSRHKWTRLSHHRAGRKNWIIPQWRHRHATVHCGSFGSGYR